MPEQLPALRNDRCLLFLERETPFLTPRAEDPYVVRVAAQVLIAI
jgi:hypothetical protein